MVFCSNPVSRSARRAFAYALVATVAGCQILGDFLPDVRYIGKESRNDRFLRFHLPGEIQVLAETLQLLIAACERTVRVLGIRHQKERLAFRFRLLEKLLGVPVVKLRVPPLTQLGGFNVVIPAELGTGGEVSILRHDAVAVARIAQTLLERRHIGSDGLESFCAIAVRIPSRHPH